MKAYYNENLKAIIQELPIVQTGKKPTIECPIDKSTKKLHDCLNTCMCLHRFTWESVSCGFPADLRDMDKLPLVLPPERSAVTHPQHRVR